MFFPKTKDNLVKMQDGIMPKENNKGKNSNFLLNPQWFEFHHVSCVWTLFTCLPKGLLILHNT
jgi:hypothetical protein